MRGKLELDELFLWIGEHFTVNVYLFHTKVQGILWGVADIFLIYFILKIADFARERAQKKKILWRYLCLWLSALLIPLLLWTKTKTQFFLLESIICGIQFSILVYTAILESKTLKNMLKKMLSSHWI